MEPITSLNACHCVLLNPWFTRYSVKHVLFTEQWGSEKTLIQSINYSFFLNEMFAKKKNLLIIELASLENISEVSDNG